MCAHDRDFFIFVHHDRPPEEASLRCIDCNEWVKAEQLPPHVFKVQLHKIAAAISAERHKQKVPAPPPPVEPAPPPPERKPAVPHKIDLCVVLMGPNVDLLFRIFMKSLMRAVTFDDEYKLMTLHVVDNGILPGHMPDVLKLFELAPTRRWHDITKIDWPPYPNAGLVCEWLLDNCGDAQWCCIVHFDILWKRDMVGSMAKRLHPKIGMLGNNAPIMLMNRAAWKTHRVPLTAMSDFYAVSIGGENVRIYHGSDRRAKPAIAAGAAKFCGGFDTAQLLETVLPAYGWHCEPLTDELDYYFHHFGSGSGHNKMANNERIRQQARDLIGKEGL